MIKNSPWHTKIWCEFQKQETKHNMPCYESCSSI
jgi:hypothetical protein